MSKPTIRHGVGIRPDGTREIVGGRRTPREAELDARVSALSAEIEVLNERLGNMERPDQPDGGTRA